MKKINYGLILLFSLLILPINVLAYSNKIVLGGETIGIQIETPGVMVIGFYPVNGENIKGSPEIKPGDLIIKVNNINISSINELTDAIEKEVLNNEIELTVNRDNKEYKIKMTLEKVDGVYKTGLYVKDSISGIGTLTYIDPETKVYGALGHEILESTSSKIVEVKTGKIFESTITSINKSSTGVAGAKNANFNINHLYGDIKTNTNHGIYGKYTDEINEETIEVAKNNEIKVGEATIITVLQGQKKEEYKINITNINEYNDIKNITFEITDQNLLDKTGGVVQGMSGSPIVQNGKIIGAVTHVVVDNPLTGYGIFITTMLETGDNYQ